MDVAELLGGGAAAAPQVPEVEELVNPVRDITPNGTLLEYQAKPKRLYRVNTVVVPSVTTILEVLDKPALPWWGMKVGVQGLLKLYADEVVQGRFDGENGFPLWLQYTDKFSIPPTEIDEAATVENLIEAFTYHKLTVNHVKEDAADRGLTVHDAFEAWTKTGTIPAPRDFPEEERGYVEGLIKFLGAADPEPLASEIMVGSATHGFAGRYDIRLRFPRDVELVVRQTPKRQRLDVIPAGVHLSDLKTSKGVYPTSHFRQLEAYEAAGVECGYEPTDERYVIHVSADGTYEYVRSYATFEDFLTVLAVWRSNERLKEAKKA